MNVTIKFNWGVCPELNVIEQSALSLDKCICLFENGWPMCDKGKTYQRYYATKSCKTGQTICVK